MPPKRKKLGRPPGSKSKKHATSSSLLKKDKNVTKKIKKENSNYKYLCGVCGKNFPTEKVLLLHAVKCNIIQLDIVQKCQFVCKECPKKFRFKESFDTHCETEHSKLPDSVACDQCTVRCPDKEALTIHIQKVHERDIFLCPHCNKEFVRHSHVLRHMAQSGCDGQGGTSYGCEICDAKFSRKDNLMVHIRLQHILKNEFHCKICSYSTKNYSKLVNHWHKHHSDTPDQYQCHHCGKWTSSRAAMTKHLEIHGEKKYSCDVCGYSTFTVEVMRRHVLTHVSDKPYKCKICNNSYIQRAQLQRHMEKHCGNVCEYCKETFPSRTKLLVHMRNHLGLNRLVCPLSSCVCSKKDFINEASLTAHLKVHIDDKPYKCEVCTKAFHSEINLRRHLETHTLDRPRRCMYCISARAYVRGEQLARHVRKHHPAVFKAHLLHVRNVLGSTNSMDRVTRSEIESIINLLDAESERILQGYSGSGVLYGGMLGDDDCANAPDSTPDPQPLQTENKKPLMSEEELAENLKKLLSQLIDKEMLSMFGWPDESVDVVLEKVIEQCGAKTAAHDKWSRVQRLRENAKHLFVYVVEDATVARMLHTHTIDQIVMHILAQVAD